MKKCEMPTAMPQESPGAIAAVGMGSGGEDIGVGPVASGVGPNAGRCGLRHGGIGCSSGASTMPGRRRSDRRHRRGGREGHDPDAPPVHARQPHRVVGRLPRGHHDEQRLPQPPQEMPEGHRLVLAAALEPKTHELSRAQQQVGIRHHGASLHRAGRRVELVVDEVHPAAMREVRLVGGRDLDRVLHLT
jgi:hypothetical protein